MTIKQIAATMVDLGETATRLEELVEWCKLAEQEQRLGRPLGFPLNRHLDEDFRSLYGLFCQLDAAVHQMLGRLDTPADDYVEDLRHRLFVLEERVRFLDLSERITRT